MQMHKTDGSDRSEHSNTPEIFTADTAEVSEVLAFVETQQAISEVTEVQAESPVESESIEAEAIAAAQTEAGESPETLSTLETATIPEQSATSSVTSHLADTTDTSDRSDVPKVQEAEATAATDRFNTSNTSDMYGTSETSESLTASALPTESAEIVEPDASLEPEATVLSTGLTTANVADAEDVDANFDRDMEADLQNPFAINADDEFDSNDDELDPDPDQALSQNLPASEHEADHQGEVSDISTTDANNLENPEHLADPEQQDLFEEIQIEFEEEGSEAEQLDSLWAEDSLDRADDLDSGVIKPVAASNSAIESEPTATQPDLEPETLDQENLEEFETLEELEEAELVDLPGALEISDDLAELETADEGAAMDVSIEVEDAPTAESAPSSQLEQTEQPEHSEET
jgi:hypothetical protein